MDTSAVYLLGMLYRMYRRFAERRGFKVTVIEEMTADFGENDVIIVLRDSSVHYITPPTSGIKSVEMKVEGRFAYGYLAGEKGTHRLVRISPFNAQGTVLYCRCWILDHTSSSKSTSFMSSEGKRQTSFAGVETWPILEEGEIDDIVIPEKVSPHYMHPSSKASSLFVLFMTLHHLFVGHGDNHDAVWGSRWTECEQGGDGSAHQAPSHRDHRQVHH